MLGPRPCTPPLASGSSSAPYSLCPLEAEPCGYFHHLQERRMRRVLLRWGLQHGGPLLQPPPPPHPSCFPSWPLSLTFSTVGQALVLHLPWTAGAAP